MQHRVLIRAVIGAAIVEMALLGWSLYEMAIGGIEGGGRVFAVLHFPSSILFSVLISSLFETATSMGVHIFFAAIVSLSQLLIFVAIFYWIVELLSRIRHKQ